MQTGRKYPSDIARHLAARQQASRGQPHTRTSETGSSAWRRETFTLPRLEARQKAQELFSAYPKAAYMTEIESWRELASGEIEFTLRRLPTAD